jgi:hypothetical protein
LNGRQVGGEDDDVLGEVAVEVTLGEAVAETNAPRPASNAVAVMLSEVHIVWAILVPWRKATAVQEAGCFPVVLGFGATGKDGEVVGSVSSRVDGIYPYLPLVAVSDSVVGGKVVCPRGRGEGIV